jgi:CheY-like chemotaxis protein
MSSILGWLFSTNNFMPHGHCFLWQAGTEPWGRDVLLVAMTGWGQAKDKDRAKAAGFDRHFTKPLDPGELQRLLAAFVEARS